MELALSASRIKTAKTCSWQYFVKYVVKLPDKSNDGASRGWICHLIFECLGRSQRVDRWKRIVSSGDVFSDLAIKRMAMKHAKKLGVDDEDNVEMIKEMTMKGLNFDFDGEHLGAPDEVLIEHAFNIEVEDEGKRFKVRGFIDKIFLYKKEKLAIIRDFKTSKKKFEGDDLNKNYQDYIYSLVVKRQFPDYNKRNSQFIFLKFGLVEGSKSDGFVGMKKITDKQLDKFEHNLTGIQTYLEGFNERRGKSNYAADQGFGEGFVGPVVCGFAKKPGELKLNGLPKWHCPFKFAFGYYVILSKDGKIRKSGFLEDFMELEKSRKEDETLERRDYQGCPRFNGNKFDITQKMR